MKKVVTPSQTALIEKLADLEHRQWCEWTKYMLNNLNEENIKRWKNQLKIKYDSLPEDQKWSDRRWAEKVLKIISKYK